MADDTYNGWTNYPTWAVNLWLSNDQRLNDATLEQVATYYDGAERDENVLPSIGPNGEQRPPIWTLEQCRRYRVADRLAEWVGELNENDNGYAVGREPTMADDLLGWALSSVNWDELAEGWIITLEENRDYEKGRR